MDSSCRPVRTRHAAPPHPSRMSCYACSPPRHELIVDTAINDAGGNVVEKQTKTRSSRTVTLDDAAVELLRQHLAEMDARAAACGTSVDSDGFVFSLDPTCSTPLRPELLTRRMRRLRQEHTASPMAASTPTIASATGRRVSGSTPGSIPPH